MVMDMLEHEVLVAGSSLATRSQQDLVSIGEGLTHVLEKSFLVKKMEISFAALPDFVTDDAGAITTAIQYLLLRTTSRDSTIDAVSEQLDARIGDREAHQGIIWMRIFDILTHLVDDADNVSTFGKSASFSTTKTFSKGFRLDKEEDYRWSVFNPHTTTVNIVSFYSIRVRYWGVFLP